MGAYFIAIKNQLKLNKFCFRSQHSYNCKLIFIIIAWNAALLRKIRIAYILHTITHNSYIIILKFLKEKMKITIVKVWQNLKQPQMYTSLNVQSTGHIYTFGFSNVNVIANSSNVKLIRRLEGYVHTSKTDNTNNRAIGMSTPFILL